MSEKNSHVTGAVAVIGGGITGIQASLDLADLGFRVYLIEKKPAIGGFMAMLDKTFPTNDCSLCILSPKLVDCGRHKDIDILTCSEVLSLEGEVGNFTLHVHKNPRYVDIEKCTACGKCSEKCPVSIPNIYEQGLSFRKAIYKFYPQAIPNAFVIDKQGIPPEYKGCIECRACEKACESGAILLDQQPEDLALHVGAVILTEGSEIYLPYDKREYGYGRFINVVTSLELERILSASGPYQGRILRPSDRKDPGRIAWIQCVGSRDSQIGNNYCSSVCCMYATKEAIITKEHAPHIETTIFYIDIRAHGKDFDKYVDRAQKKYGVRYVRSKISEIAEDPGSKDLILRYEDDHGDLFEERYGMAVLSVGFCPSPEKRKLLETLGVRMNSFGFGDTNLEDPVASSREGVFIAGSLNEPMAIPESVMQASAAAAKAAEFLSVSRGAQIREKTFPPETSVENKPPRIGCFICHCGTNIAGYLDVEELSRFSRTLPDVVFADTLMYSCAQDSQKKIVETIRQYALNRVVVAACSPRTHESLFQDTLREAGLNPYLFEMANIRDQCSWTHMDFPQEATEKAKDLIAMAAAKAGRLEPLPAGKVEIHPQALVIGGGVAGLTAALSLADQGFKTFIVEREKRLGGMLNKLYNTLEGLDLSSFIRTLVDKALSHEAIEVFTEARIERIDGYVGNFTTEISSGGEKKILSHGAIIVAIGTKEAETEEYLRGSDERVLSQRQLEDYLERLDPGDIPNGKTFVMIQCVGSRTENVPWCSRICCAQAVKNALRIKEINPRAEVYVFYRDMRTYGFKEEYYEKARKNGVIFLRYDPESPPEAIPRGNRLFVRVEEQLMREEIEVPADMVILSLGLAPQDGREELAKMLKVPLNEDGFFLEAHVKLRPVDFATEGIFVAGTCHAPKFIEETIAQAQAAAGRAAGILSHREMETSGLVSRINPNLCRACGLCIDICPYKAISLDEEKNVAVVNIALCKGCGLCAASCRGGAPDLGGFTDSEITAQLGALS
ncbi:CoB--CoM heterodisulfide reductase iron-sulfur subunit A family protein [Candidatus Sumerlaeota bacterium]|nr:CoB--CoM heterodisulfide reductase iron-sulfur subunit A family protein [Candidatus Sumerlaeota bacterium]